MWKEEQGWVTLVCSEICPVHRSRTSHFPALRRARDRASRTLRGSGSSEESAGDQQADQHGRHTATVLPTGNCGQGKGQTDDSPDPETPVWDLEEDPDLFEMIPTDTGVVQNQQIEHLETRMLNVEGMLSNILQHLENLTVNRCTEQ